MKIYLILLFSSILPLKSIHINKDTLFISSNSVYYSINKNDKLLKVKGLIFQSINDYELSFNFGNKTDFPTKLSKYFVISKKKQSYNIPYIYIKKLEETDIETKGIHLIVSPNTKEKPIKIVLYLKREEKEKYLNKIKSNVAKLQKLETITNLNLKLYEKSLAFIKGKKFTEKQKSKYYKKLMTLNIYEPLIQLLQNNDNCSEQEKIIKNTIKTLTQIQEKDIYFEKTSKNEFDIYSQQRLNFQSIVHDLRAKLSEKLNILLPFFGKKEHELYECFRKNELKKLKAQIKIF